MYEVLNVDEKKLIAQLGEKSRDETFEPVAPPVRLVLKPSDNPIESVLL